jgi:hypothetical protein
MRSRWIQAKHEITVPRRRRKRILRQHFRSAGNHVAQQIQPVALTRGELYHYHRMNGTLGLYYLLYGMPSL